MLLKLTRFLILPLMILAQMQPAAFSQDQEYYELRVFRNADAQKQAGVLSYVADALLPALNRLGSSTVGVFTPAPAESGEGSGDVYLLIPYASLQKFEALRPALQVDAEYLKASSGFMSAPTSDPAYSRIESRLMKAFAGLPKLQLPSQESADRILELRIYESRTQEHARLKVEMFNEGEIQIMKDVKLAPVFFGETLISSDMPNLTYMLSADNAEVHKQHFQGFLKHPDWDRMKKLEKYKGTVSKIVSVMLLPAKCSQI